MLVGCLLLAGCTDATKPVASEDQSTLSPSSVTPSAPLASTTSTIPETTTSAPTTSTASTSTLPSETPSAESILLERAAQASRDEATPDDPSTLLVKFLLTQFSPDAPNSPTPVWLTQQQLTQLSEELENLPAEQTSEIAEVLSKYVETEETCGNNLGIQDEFSECPPVFLEVCDNFTILRTELKEPEESYFSSLWFDIGKIVCYVSDAFEFIDSTEEIDERCSQLWSEENFEGTLRIEFLQNRIDLPLSYIRPVQNRSGIPNMELWEKCAADYDGICLEITELQSRVTDFPIWFLANYVSSNFGEFLTDAAILGDTARWFCLSAEIFGDLLDLFQTMLDFSEACQNIDTFESEPLYETSLVKLNISITNTVLSMQLEADESLLAECTEILQGICSDIKSFVMKLEEFSATTEESEGWVELYSAIETLYCELADTFSQR